MRRGPARFPVTAIGGVVLGASLLVWLPAARDWDVRARPASLAWVADEG
ncbi:MAG: hypothetical protein ACRDPS_13730 [Nocardioides sp.]